MMEFTLSRISMIACGLILLAAVISPVSAAYGNMQDAEMRDAADGIARTVDRFWDSRADVMYLRGWDVLPSPDCGLEMDGYDLKITKNGKEYRSLMEHRAIPVSMSFNEMAEIERDGNDLKITISET